MLARQAPDILGVYLLVLIISEAAASAAPAALSTLPAVGRLVLVLVRHLLVAVAALGRVAAAIVIILIRLQLLLQQASCGSWCAV